MVPRRVHPVRPDLRIAARTRRGCALPRVTRPTTMSTFRTPFFAAAVSTLGAVLLTACAGMAGGPMFSQDSLPEAVRVPAGHRVALETVGVGRITYECRAKSGMAGAFEWTFVGPDATLAQRNGAAIGRYYGPPATWEASDGSKVTGAQLAVAPAMAGSIPLQLVKANPAMGEGMAMKGVSYIQRVATRGGVAPAMPCTGDSVGRKEVVDYRADYIFWKAA